MASRDRIDSLEELEAAADRLCAVEPRFAHVRAVCGPMRLRRQEDGFAALLEMIVGQQVSVASADAVWRRLQAAGLTEAAAVLAAGEDALRACGLSRQKLRYARALAGAGIDYAALRGAAPAGVVAVLTAVPGIGRWTAEIYAKFALGHADVMAAGDLALQEGARLLFALPDRPDERALRGLAEGWSPWRTVAACLLWQYYAHARGRQGIRTA
jgi:DNA-3-methyladenine glycosylase II